MKKSVLLVVATILLSSVALAGCPPPPHPGHHPVHPPRPPHP